ncbi:MAG TPA: aminoglycoside phosphotransferase family protein [Mesorhizobium sp.]
MKAPVRIDAALVARLIAAQFPHWADLQVIPIEPGGWDNRTFHLGTEMVARLPSAASYAAQVEKEQTWLPRLAPQLPLPIPQPVAHGRPGEGYPWPWSVYRWLDGKPATVEQIADVEQFAIDLAGFLVALRSADPTGGPLPGPHNFHRGAGPGVYDAEVRAAMVGLDGQIDTKAARRVWAEALSSRWTGPPVWFHGDVAWGNLLVREGRLCAVIDFGTSGIGDPACDLAIAWTLFSGRSRTAFRDALGLDDATWARGRGWTLWKALITAAGHDANQRETTKARRVIDYLLRCE